MDVAVRMGEYMTTIQERRKQIERSTAGAYPTQEERYPTAWERDFGRALREQVYESPTCVHFVGFKGDEYTSAVRVFGKPDFFHRKNDIRLVFGGELAPHDIVVYANGSENAVLLSAVDDSNIDVQKFEMEVLKNPELAPK